jgi:redox-sensitive bicupin YhaK (pirin superfamily)
MEQNKDGIIELNHVWEGDETQDGEGVKLVRVIGGEVAQIDPFLLLDQVKGFKLPGGFPDHPHRGFETVTYITKGKTMHEDFYGNKGELNPGDVQWMTAGKGIVHSEMPASFDEESAGFQLWVNLKKEKKMIDPYYQEVKSDKIPVIETPSGTIKIICGEYNNVTGPCQANTSISYFDVHVNPNQSIEIPVIKGMNGFVFIYEGDKIKVGNKSILKLYNCGRFSTEKDSKIKLECPEGLNLCKCLLVFGEPLNEPLKRYGPFVMNSEKEIREAFDDYQNCKNGFEKAKNWESDISRMKYK